MPLEKYNKIPRSSHYEPIITINRCGILGINTTCHKRYFQGYNYVRLYYDKQKKIVGIEPVKDDPNCFRLKAEPYQSIGISCRGFFKYFGIPFGKTTRCNPRWNKDKKLLEVDISEHLQGN